MIAARRVAAWLASLSVLGIILAGRSCVRRLAQLVLPCRARRQSGVRDMAFYSVLKKQRYR